ncbi:baseplate multidomain protein megatron [Flexibacterium corallicola]|uniref:baseplate multidomain protein megatron n=1 Tax=Flexibacterium corallicola TaxID=3037259 RepID=UPI00286F523A|nr:glycoside hydrolase TIM-barrel-like domain-containing protein [Pseudovibrio sp. M1P-2-3]
MSTMILSGVGSVVGGMLGGPVGASIGQALGAVAGSYIDQELFGEDTVISDGKLGDMNLQTSAEGRALPFVYGRVRISGEIIWATRYEEVVTKESQGGKSAGPSTTVEEHSYFCNFALALCEGEIACVRRIWADGKLLDTSGLTMRVYTGSLNQLPDPLIEAKQGQAPAYRGTAYVVFERMPLADYGNRIPQLSFEVVRVVEPLEEMVKAVTLIPAAGEFIYDTKEVLSRSSSKATKTLNRHLAFGGTDWSNALDELQALCPNLESVALVVSWFGDDLRCGHCAIRPKVVSDIRETLPHEWQVAGLERSQAEAVSYIDGSASFGGTPSDASVIRAIKDLRARGLSVMLYPFILMDIPAGNGLPDPYGRAEQAAFPWRGRITTSLSYGQTGSPQRTSAAESEVSSFLGNGDDWRYCRFISHYAELAEEAGGVDAFLIGSELVGMTRVLGEGNGFPFVEGLKTLLLDVRAILRGETKLSYAADWSEYASYTPEEGELYFPLDPLWASDALDFIGIDNYLPLADSREEDAVQDRYSLEALQGGVTTGEYYDWYYASEADRTSKTRSVISDGAYSKPWVYRAKDIAGFWGNTHFERIGGVEKGSPTDWVPQSKPIWFTETGVPAVHMGANQPNVFYDPKSSESHFPHFSNGVRDDLIQRRSLEALLNAWEGGHPDTPLGQMDMPLSPLYNGPMVQSGSTFLWTWDARPYPAFPAFSSVWHDGGNWERGHWLNGRLGTCSTKGLLKALALDFGIPADILRFEELPEQVDGFVASGPNALRTHMEPLLQALGGVASDTGTQVAFTPRWEKRAPATSTPLGLGDLLEGDEGKAPVSLQRKQASELPAELRLTAYDPLSDYAGLSVSSRRLEGAGQRVVTQTLSVCAGRERLTRLAQKQLQSLWQERDVASFKLSMRFLGLVAGSIVELGQDVLPDGAETALYRIERLEMAEGLEVEAIRLGGMLLTSGRSGSLEDADAPSFGGERVGPPSVLLADLPFLSQSLNGNGEPMVAVAANPWPGQVDLFRMMGTQSAKAVLSINSPSTFGQTLSDLGAGPLWRWDRSNFVDVELVYGELATLSEAEVLAGENVCAVRGASGAWELLQFTNAELIGQGTYRLRGFLRGQQGTEKQALAGTPAGADFLLLNENVNALPWSTDMLELEQSLRFVPKGEALDSPFVTDRVFMAEGQALKPLSPVHMKVDQQLADDLLFSWVRRVRLNGDSWVPADLPVHEEQEVYAISIKTQQGAVLRQTQVLEPSFIYSRDAQLEDTGGSEAELVLSLRQLSASVGAGEEASLEFKVLAQI